MLGRASTSKWCEILPTFGDLSAALLYHILATPNQISLSRSSASSMAMRYRARSPRHSIQVSRKLGTDSIKRAIMLYARYTMPTYDLGNWEAYASRAQETSEFRGVTS